MCGYVWTPERRKLQSDILKKIKPWEKSTGPKTKEGKNVSSLNALKHGENSKDSDVLLSRSRISASLKIPLEKAPIELIELKRAHLLLKRELKKLKD